VVAIGTPGLEAVIAEFGERMRGPDGGLDRPRLASVVFADEAARLRLNAIVHPLIAARIAELRQAAMATDPDGIVIHDSPLLVETDAMDDYDVVVVVDASDAARLDRLVRVRGMTADDARARMSAQATREQRLAVADLVVVNDADLGALDAAVDEIWTTLRSMQSGARRTPDTQTGRK